MSVVTGGEKSVITQENNLPVAIKEDRKRKTSAVTQDQEKKNGKMSKTTQEEKKPVEESPYIVIHVTAQDGGKLFFKLQVTTPLQKLMKVYCDKKFMNMEQIVFLFDSKRIRGKQTPKELEMMDGDEINAMLHMNGGGFA
ncbi:small ubiquitin-related modifier 1-like [Nicotiana tomentosiformis]|uniref:small ubiquitin-related modifier 1-like n=1 Tax=Nicotiana tomentosiformis TaxID=4098 RepID=UPI00051CA3A5